MAPFSHHGNSHTSHDPMPPEEEAAFYPGFTLWPVHQQHPPTSGPSSAMIPRPELSTERQVLPFHSTGPDHYVNHQSDHTIWQTSDYYRTERGAGVDSFNPSPLQVFSSEGEATASVPHPSFAFPRQDTLVRAHNAQLVQQPQLLPQDASNHSFHPPPVEYTAGPTVPLYHSGDLTGAPVPYLLNHTPSTASIQVHTQPLASQTPITWSRPASDVLPTTHQPFQHDHPQSPSHIGLATATSSNAPDHMWASTACEHYPAAPLPACSHMANDVSPTDDMYRENPLARTRRSWYDLARIDHTLTGHRKFSPVRNRRSSNKGKDNKPKIASSFVERQRKIKVSKRKGPLSEASRQDAMKMRKGRPCVRCMIYHAKCDLGDPCQRCAAVIDTARSFLIPCFRDRFEDTSLVRHCNGRCNQIEAKFFTYVWQGASMYVMDIAWHLSGSPHSMPIGIPLLRVECKEFHPEEADPNSNKITYLNKAGRYCEIKQPPYAVFDTKALRLNAEAYFCSHLRTIEQWIMQRISRDELATITYKEALRMRDRGSKILETALRINCLSVMSQGYGTIYSTDANGILEYDFEQMGRSDYEAYDRNSRDRPLPPAIAHQMDVAILSILRSLEKSVHKLLDKLIVKKQGIKPWYEIFLVYFVLFWNLEYMRQGADRYMRSKKNIVTQKHVSSVVQRQINRWHETYVIMLKYWTVLRREFKPFELARKNPEELRVRGHLDEQGFHCIRQIAAILDRTGNDQHKPPLTGLSDKLYTTQSDWIVELLKSAGA